MAANTVTPPLGARRAEIEEVDGPIVSASEIEIEAPVQTVWNVLTDLDRWPSWNQDVKAIASDPGALAEGFVFRWKAGPGQITSTVAEVSPPHRIAWNGKTLGIDAYHVWRLVPLGGRRWFTLRSPTGGSLVGSSGSPSSGRLTAAWIAVSSL